MSEERKKILNLLEEGHITAEEAEKLLEALEKTKEHQNHQTDDKTSFKKDLKNLTEGLFTMIDDTIQRIKDGPFEFNFDHVNVKRKYEFDSENVKHFNFDLANGSVEFVPTSDSMIHIQCHGKVYKEKDQDEAEKFFDESMNVEVQEETLKIDQDHKNISVKLIISLPKKAYEQAYIKTVNGSVKATDLQLEVARISTVNGRVNMNQYRGDAVYIEAKHGSLRLDEVTLSKAKLETTTGSVYYDGNVDDLDVDVTTGSVRTYIHNSNARRVDLYTTTGSTQLYLPKGAKVKGYANTHVGSVDINIKEAVVNTMEHHMMKKSWEFSNVTDQQDYLDVEVQTKTGSIRINTLS